MWGDSWPHSTSRWFRSGFQKIEAHGFYQGLIPIDVPSAGARIHRAPEEVSLTVTGYFTP
jgi:hypothetical protein